MWPDVCPGSQVLTLLPPLVLISAKAGAPPHPPSLALALTPPSWKPVLPNMDLSSSLVITVDVQVLVLGCW